MTSTAALRRALALAPDARRLDQVVPLSERALSGPLPTAEVTQILGAYLLDPAAGAILATTEERTSWLGKPLFRWIGPGNAIPIDDQIAALIAAPRLLGAGVLAPQLVARRFTPRADDAIAIAVAALPRDAQAGALAALAADPGPEPELLALSTIQCGRVLAWSPHLLELPAAEPIVAALLALISPKRPRPLLELAARALGPLAASDGALAQRVRDAAFAGLRVERPTATSFSEELAAIGAKRAVQGIDQARALPALEAAAAWAYVLGRAAPMDREGFGALRELVLGRPDGDELMPSFVDGLIAAAHVPAVSELVLGMIGAQDAETSAAAFLLAAQLPLDPIAPVLLGELDDPATRRRARACAAVELLDGEAIDEALVARLADPVPDVAAAAARSLAARGRHDALAEHAAREGSPVRRAIALAAAREVTAEIVGELVRGVMAEDGDAGDSAAEPGSITRLVGEALLGSIAGTEIAADLIGGIPEAAGLLALAALPEAERDAGVLAPPDVRQRLAASVLRVATAAEHAGDELGALALYLLARVSAGDEVVAEVVAEALTSTDGYAAQLVAALGEVRVASAATATALAPLVAPDQPHGARVLSAAVCGRALPREHDAWAHIRGLLELGTIARAAAWAALRDRARRTPV